MSRLLGGVEGVRREEGGWESKSEEIWDLRMGRVRR